ncbi:MAG: hypothetical protein J6Y37_07380 [Paludibacteraceae bacterium]|nr:hypothetical protein [Paludibacteraceae bacterium]
MKTDNAYTRINHLVGLAPIVLFLSSYVPLFVLIIVRQTLSNLEYLSWGGINEESIVCMIRHFGMSIVCFIMTFLGLIGTWLVLDNLNERVKSGHTFKIEELSSMNDEPLAYIATYIIPLLFDDYNNLTDFLTIICIFYIVYRLYIRSKLILVNPILSLKYSIYNVKYIDGDIPRQGILISNNNDILEDDQVKMYNIGHQLFFGYKRQKI